MLVVNIAAQGNHQKLLILFRWQDLYTTIDARKLVCFIDQYRPEVLVSLLSPHIWAPNIDKHQLFKDQTCDKRSDILN